MPARVLRLRGARAWVACLAILAAVGAALVAYPPQRQAPVTLVLLLLVLLGSITGGRGLGMVLAGVGFLLIDYYFQLPYGRLGVDDPADWMVLGSYVVTAWVGSYLVVRIREEAEAARRRAAEVERLADLGAETLSAGRAEEALQAIASVIARTLRLDACEVWDVGADGEARRAAAWGAAVFDEDDPRAAREREVLLTRVRRCAARGVRAAPVDGAQRARRLGELLAGAPGDVLVPLSAHQRAVGALRLVRASGLALDESERTFLDALAHYAALGVERARLVADAERAEALREADRLKDFVLATVSHDLRTPLTTIKALAHERARAGDEAAATIEEQADRLGRLVGDLLDLSRVRAGGLPLTLELNTAEDVVGAALRQVTGALGPLGSRRVEARLREDGGPLLGRFDFVATLRVLGNLLENAAKYSPADAPIALDVAREGAELVFAVADCGPGVGNEERERIFAPFYRAPDAPPDVGGAGLGLAVARAFATAQGGSLAHAPRPGGGSVFTLRLPASDDPDALRLLAGEDGAGAAA